jgi:5-formyltetrahydrofolate cyclo-ligase
LLAGSIVQVRLERKALNAAVSPTCCSGREQRSKTAHAGSAISKLADNKTLLRKELRARRKRLPAAQHARLSARAAKFITQLAQFSCGRRIALTLSFDREADTAALISAARKRGVHLYSPVIIDKRQRRLRFYPLEQGTRRGTYGILVPRRKVRPVTPRWFDLIVVPLVGVDPKGRRLGMGGGYYDGAMAFRRQRKHWRGPRLVGFAFDCQRTASVYADSWDLKLDDLATESGLHHFRENTA